MPLFVVATPIGNKKDITLRAIEVLTNCDVVIGEEFKEASKFLKSVSIQNKEIYTLNEHSDQRDLQELFDLAKSQKVVLVSDCGTPGFCDPGSNLIHMCRKNNVPVEVIPGASSLMVFLSGCGVDLKTFHFCGFLPAKSEERARSWSELKKIPSSLIIMDTPYRLGRLLAELNEHFKESKIAIGLDLTAPTEEFLCDTAQRLQKHLGDQKREFILAVLK